jgi:hypothetical protein
MYSDIKAAEAAPADKAITSAPVEAEEAPDEVTTAPTSETPETEQTPEQKMVPLPALHEERRARQQLQAELRDMRARQEQQAQEQAQRDHDYQLAQQRLMQVIAARDQPPAPSAESDPLAYTAQVAAQTQQQVQALAQQQQWRDQQMQQQQQQWQQQQAQQNQVQQLVRLTTQSEAEFSKVKPDYNDAVAYAKGRRVKELVAAGYAQEDATQFAQREGWQLAHTWLSQGMNPAERAYAFAQAMGYQPRASEEDVQEMHEQGQRAAKPSGGGATRGRNTVAAIAQMSPKQLAALSDDEFRAAMGG